jgi:hypothetical protein
VIKDPEVTKMPTPTQPDIPMPECVDKRIDILQYE